MTEIQKQILKCLLETDPQECYYYSYIEEETNQTKKTLRAEMKGLLKLGLVEHIKGLFDDGGMVAGSGFQIAYTRRKDVVEILK